MSATTSMGSVPPEVVIPIIENFAHSIQPAFPFILISAVFSAMLIPLLVMLVALSTPRSRRQPIFLLNVLTITLGVIVGVISNHLTITSILSPLKGINPTEDLAYNALYLWLPWITEAILILRVIIVYSPRYSSKLRILQILTFTIIIKAARAGLNIAFLVEWKKSTTGGGGSVNQFSTTQAAATWIPKAGWILELVDNLYISGLFLLRLAAQGHLFNGESVGRVSGCNGRVVSFTGRLKTLFWIASTNVIFPLILSLIQIIIIFSSDSNVLLAASIEMANIYISIISTAFATIWAATSSFKEAHQSIYQDSQETSSAPSGRGTEIETIVFSSATVTTRSDPETTTSNVSDNAEKAWSTGPGK